MLNSVVIVANLTRDPELRYTPSGAAVCNLGLACNRSYKPAGSDEYKKETCFISAVVWGKRAENCSNSLKKGSPVFISGRLQSRSWEKDGQKRSTIEIIAEDIQFLDRTGEEASLPEGPEPGESADA